MPFADPEKKRDYHRKYMKKRWTEDPEFRAKHLAKVAAYNKAQAEKVDQLVATFRANGCSLCPEKNECCLSAHHLDPTKKDFSISQARASGRRSPKIVARELEKCVCLCHNCHAKVHAGITQCPSAWERAS